MLLGALGAQDLVAAHNLPQLKLREPCDADVKGTWRLRFRNLVQPVSSGRRFGQFAASLTHERTTCRGHQRRAAPGPRPEERAKNTPPSRYQQAGSARAGSEPPNPPPTSCCLLLPWEAAAVFARDRFSGYTVRYRIPITRRDSSYRDRRLDATRLTSELPAIAHGGPAGRELSIAG
jgi:hypothetical protein